MFGKIAGYVVGIGAIVFAASLVPSSQALAYNGQGYFTGNPNVCNTSGGGPSCGAGSMSLNDDVMPGRAGGIPNAIPDSATTSKAAFMAWLIGQYNAGGHARHGAQFIIATMLGSQAQRDNIPELQARMANPDLTIDHPLGAMDPNAFGSISFRGRVDGTGEYDFFWTNAYNSSPRRLIFFRLNGAIVYVLEQPCGNPVGMPNIPGLPVAENWSISGNSTIHQVGMGGGFVGGTVNGGVGDTFEWRHMIRNDGPTDMISGISYVGVRQGFTGASGYNNGWAASSPPMQQPFNNTESAKAAAGAQIYNSTVNMSGSGYMEYTITDDDVGNTLCQWMAAVPGNSSGGGWWDGPKACVYVPFDYTLIPQINLSTSVVETPSQNYNVLTSVDHDGTKSQDTNWRIVKLVFDATLPDPSALGPFASPGEGDQAPCAYFTGDISCIDWRSGSSVYTGDFTYPAETDSLGPDFNVNRRICYAFAVNKPSQDGPPAPSWGYSGLKCLVAAKRPKIQIWGNDVRVGGGFTSSTVNPLASINTSISSTPTNVHGSWAEYGLIAPLGAVGSPGSGVITSASGGSLSGTDGAMLPQSAADRNRLTFANTSTPYGRWGAPRLFPDFVDDIVRPPFTDTIPAANLDLGSAALSSGTRNLIQATNSSLSVHGNPAGDKRTVILYSPETITIDGNIELFDNEIRSAMDVQQVIIVARNIIIGNNVSRVDAWLIARATGLDDGVISTCDTAPASGYYEDLAVGGVCDSTPLRINGPIMARELQLRRTVGTGAEAAEVANMRPDAYMWAMAQSQAGGRIDTMFTTELPPRF